MARRNRKGGWRSQGRARSREGWSRRSGRRHRSYFRPRRRRPSNRCGRARRLPRGRWDRHRPRRHRKRFVRSCPGSPHPSFPRKEGREERTHQGTAPAPSAGGNPLTALDGLEMSAEHVPHVRVELAVCRPPSRTRADSSRPWSTTRISTAPTQTRSFISFTSGPPR